MVIFCNLNNILYRIKCPLGIYYNGTYYLAKIIKKISTIKFLSVF